MSEKPWHDGELLRELYVEERKTTTEIANELECGSTTISTWLKKHNIKTRNSGGHNSHERRDDESWLRRKYIDEEMTVQEIADSIEVSASTVHKWIKTHDIEKQKNWISDKRLTDESWLREEYVENKKDSSEIAIELDCSSETVLRWLERHGIEKRKRGPQTPDKRLTDESWLREQYIELEKSTVEIANELGCNGSLVANWLHRHGIETRLQTPTPLTKKSWLQQQYVQDEKTITEIASALDCGPSTVAKWLQRHDIETRKGGPSPADDRLTDKEWLHEQYIQQEKSSLEIAEEIGCHDQTVLNWLQKHNIETRDSTPPSQDPPKNLLDDEWLREQYEQKGRTISEIADEVGCAHKTVSRYLKKNGINTRTATMSDKYTSEEWLRRKYVNERMSTYEIGEQIGWSARAVHQWLRKHNIEIRESGVQYPQLMNKEWLREEYIEKERTTVEIADEVGCAYNTVARWLHEHDIRIRGPSERIESTPEGFTYGPGWNESKREHIRESQGRICATCGLSESDHIQEYNERLHVHHKTPAKDFTDPERRNDESNLVALCRDCHVMWERVAPLFPETSVLSE